MGTAERCARAVKLALLCLVLSGAPASADADPDGGIWPSLREEFQLQRYFDNPAVQDWKQRYRAHRYNTDTLLERSRPWLWHIKQAAIERHLPAELALLPAIESAFDPTARSSWRAVGMWQFMAPTAKVYGLRATDWYDGRNDVLRSTVAAMDYLKYLHDRFGTWPLAVAAYNAGEGRISGALRKVRQQERSFWSLKLVRETREHVPRWLGLAAYIHEADRNSDRLPAIADRPLIRRVTLPGQITLPVAAELSEVSLPVLQTLNPALRMGATDPDGPHELTLPMTAAARLERQVASMPTDQLVRYEQYKIRNGDSLSVLAARRGTTVRELLRINQLDSTSIRAGRSLLLPEALPHARSEPDLPDGPRGHRRHIHVVSSGESLWTLARKYRTSSRQLAYWNAMSTRDPLRIGKELVVWQAEST